jgi:hypothetical protein
MPAPLSHIKSVEALRQERFRVQQRIIEHEKEFKKKLQQLPAELAAAGANSLIPPFLRGKITNSALNGGKFLINKFFVTPEANQRSLLPASSKNGILPFVKTVFKMFKGK